MRIKCHRCGHEWNYKGYKSKNKYKSFCTCPKCSTKVKVKETTDDKKEIITPESKKIKWYGE